MPGFDQLLASLTGAAPSTLEQQPSIVDVLGLEQFHTSYDPSATMPSLTMPSLTMPSLTSTTPSQAGLSSASNLAGQGSGEFAQPLPISHRIATLPAQRRNQGTSSSHTKGEASQQEGDPTYGEFQPVLYLCYPHLITHL